MLDRLYARFLAAPMFRGGWGDLRTIERLRASPPWRHTGGAALPRWREPEKSAGCECRLGSFDSPCQGLEALVRTAWVQWRRSARRSLDWCGSSCRRLVIVAGGSGEEGFGLRRRLWTSLTAEGIDFLMLETPWHGLRRPARTRGIPSVSDQLLMNVGTALELQALVGWAHGEGYEDVTLAGYSMGAFMAGVALCHLIDPAHPVRALLLAAGTTALPAYLEAPHVRKIDLEALGHTLQLRPQGAAQELASLLCAADLDRQPLPAWPGGIHIVAARRDRYLPLRGAERLHRHWSGSTLQVLDTDHIGLVVWERRGLREALRALLRRRRPD